MLTPNIQQQLDALGTAQVIVALKYVPPQPGAAGASLSLAATEVGDAVVDLQQHFVEAPASQDQALARSLARRVLRQSGRRNGAMLTAASTADLSWLVPDVPSPPKMRLFRNLGLMLGTTDRKGVAALNDDRRVDWVTGAPHVLFIRPVRSAPAALAAGATWGLERLRIPEVWAKGFTGKGVLVGHLDTGVDGTHPAVKPAIAHFAEFDMMGNPVPGAAAHDSGEHGTHTAGTIAGRKVKGTAFGVAPGAQLASALVIEGGNVVARILAGMDWVVGLGVRVLSMSLGLPGWQEDFLPVVQVLRARGVLPVFAVGNEGPGTSRSPGNYIEALSVGACDDTDQVASFSSSQRFQRIDNPLVPDLVAPGVNVISSVPGGGYASMDGSSMATPHIAGLAALLFEALGNTMTGEPAVNAVETAIFTSCQLPPGMAQERGNRGVPDGLRALAALPVPGGPAGGGGAEGAAAPPPGDGETAAPPKTRRGRRTERKKAPTHGPRKTRSRAHSAT